MHIPYNGFANNGQSFSRVAKLVARKVFIGSNEFRMVEFTAEALFNTRVFRWRIRDANIATDDSGRFAQFPERPLKIENENLPVSQLVMASSAQRQLRSIVT